MLRKSLFIFPVLKFFTVANCEKRLQAEGKFDYFKHGKDWTGKCANVSSD